MIKKEFSHGLTSPCDPGLECDKVYKLEESSNLDSPNSYPPGSTILTLALLATRLHGLLFTCLEGNWRAEAQGVSIPVEFDGR